MSAKASITIGIEESVPPARAAVSHDRGVRAKKGRFRERKRLHFKVHPS
jgi:hypothetical protein